MPRRMLRPSGEMITLFLMMRKLSPVPSATKPSGSRSSALSASGLGYGGGRALQVRASGDGDTGANRIRTTLTSALNPGQTATIRAKVRWLTGHGLWPFGLYRIGLAAVVLWWWRPGR